MVQFSWQYRIYSFLLLLHDSAGYKPPISEDVGDDDWGAILTYLDYGEPTFDHAKGLTKDDFTDSYEGYQTEESLAKSFGWDFAGHGEVPFAAMLLSKSNTNRACMGVFVTRRDLLAPCACVRTKIFKELRKVDPEPKKWYYYRNDLGEDIFVVANEIELDSRKLSLDHYPKIDHIVSSKKCTDIYGGVTWEDDIDIHRQKWAPAILNITGQVFYEAISRWPPEPIGYSSGPFDVGVGDTAWKFYDIAPGSPRYMGEIVSYRFIPTDVRKDKSKDNFKRRYFKVQDRLVQLNARLCSQSLCYFNEGFRLANRYLQESDQLKDMLCWCDFINLDSEDAYMNWKDPAIPHYTKTVYEGLLGAPIVHKGNWVGWIVHTVNQTSTDEDPKLDWPVRTTWARRVDDDIIDYVNEVIPELTGGNQPKTDDKTRPGFALRSYQLFIPDEKLNQEDVDINFFNKEGFRRHYRRRGIRSASTITQGYVLLMISFTSVLFSP